MNTKKWLLCAVIVLVLGISVFLVGKFGVAKFDNPANWTYETFVTDVSNSGGVSVDVSKIWQSIDLEKLKHSDQFETTFNNQKISGTFETTRRLSNKSHAVHIYANDEVEFYIRSDTQALTEIHFTRKRDYLDTEPFLPDVKNPEDTAVKTATELAKNLIDVNKYKQLPISTNEHVFEKNGVQHKLIRYHVMFVKMVDGLQSTDYVNVIVNNKGHVDAVWIGELGAFDRIQEGSISKDKLDGVVSQKTEELFKSSDYEITKQELCRTPEGKNAIVSQIVVKQTDENGEFFETGVTLTTIL